VFAVVIVTYNHTYTFYNSIHNCSIV